MAQRGFLRFSFMLALALLPVRGSLTRSFLLENHTSHECAPWSCRAYRRSVLNGTGKWGQNRAVGTVDNPLSDLSSYPTHVKSYQLGRRIASPKVWNAEAGSYMLVKLIGQNIFDNKYCFASSPHLPFVRSTTRDISPLCLSF